MSQRYMGTYIIPCVSCGRSHPIYTTGRLITPSAVRRVSTRCAKKHGRLLDLEDARACADALADVKPAPVVPSRSYLTGRVPDRRLN